MKTSWGTTLPGSRVSRQRWVGGGWWSPAILEITILKNIFIVWSWIWQYMLETSFPSFISKKSGEILIFRTFLAKNSILAYISLKIAKLGKIGNYYVIVMSYVWYLYFIWYVWKEKTHSYTMVPNKHTSGVYFFKFMGGCCSHRGFQQPPLVSRVTKNSLVRPGLKDQWFL